MLLHNLANYSLDFFHLVADNSSDTGGTSDGFKTAVVVTAGGVISAAFAALAIILPNHRAAPATPAPSPPPSIEDDPLVKELRRRLAEYERDENTNETIISGQAAMIERLRDFCWSNQLDPINWRRMQQGETRENVVGTPPSS